MEGTVVVSGDGYSNVDPASNATGLSIQTDAIPTHHVAILPGDPVSTVGTEATEHEEVTGLTTGTGPTGDTVAPMDMSAGGEGGRNTVELVDSTAEEMCSCCFTTKKLVVSYILWGIPFTGLFGIHLLYLRQFGLFFLLLINWFITSQFISVISYCPYCLLVPACLILLPWIYDAFRIPSMVQRANTTPHGGLLCCSVHHTTLSSLDAYRAWFPLGFFGGHWLYMKQYDVALAYLFSLGGWGVLALSDLILMPYHVKKSNEKNATSSPKHKSLAKAYLFWIPFGGLLGFHHFYLRRYFIGMIYMCTLGLLGVGWIVDGIRMYWLVKQVNEQLQLTEVPDHESNFPFTIPSSTAILPGEPAIVPVDDQMLAEAGHKFESFMCPISRSWRMDYMDTYILWFPLGWLGLHQLYMRNYVRFLALFLSLGGWFVVWILDGFLIPWQMKISRTSRTSTQKSLYTAYLAWIPFGGWLGLHHYYLGNYCRGVLYMFTLGLFGIGWLYDGFAMYWHIKKANRRAAPAPIPAAAPPIEPPGPTIVVGM